MLGNSEKRTVKLQCTEQALPEFPNLLFGTLIDSNVSYFDATLYLQKQNLRQTVQEFFATYKTPIESLSESYNIPLDDVCKINEEDHILIDSNFVYLFISFVDHSFLAYMCDCFHELMTNGIAVSDTYLLHAVKNRLSKEAINTIFGDEQQSK